MQIRHAVALAPALALLLAPVSVMAQEQGQAAKTPWTTIEPGGETSCATGTPYAFHVKPGEGADAAKLMIFLGGGGACWTGEQCDPSSAVYIPYARPQPNEPRWRSEYMGRLGLSERVDPANPRDWRGIFDLGNPENPVAKWTQVYAGYCTGDVYLGNRDVTYKTADGREVAIRHRGRANVHSVLSWVYENVKKPERIIVAGSSAGAIGAPFYAAEVADHYPDVEITAVADGAGGYRSPKIADAIQNWGFWDGAPEWTGGVDRESPTFEALGRAAVKHAPRLRVVELDTAYDMAQERFQKALGTPSRLYPLLLQNRAEQAKEIPGFAGYTSRGKEHTQLLFDRFYTNEEEGVRVVDWFRDVTEGREVKSVTCGEPESCEKEPE
jgi:hypothetical protein